MSDQVRQQVLLEIALSIGGESDAQRLLDRSLPLIARRIGAIAAGVVRVEDGDWETVHVTPRALGRGTTWRDLVTMVRDSLPDQQVATWARTCDFGTAHVFRLADYGVLIVARAEALESPFAQAFVPLAEVLARPLIAGREQQLRLAAEVELRSLGSRYRGLLDALPFSAWLLDTEGRYLQVNSAFLARSGLDEATLLGRAAVEVLPAPLGERALAATRQVLRTRQPYTVRDHDPDDGRYYEVDRTPYLDEDGEVLGVVGFRRDVTQRKEAEDTVAYLAGFQELVTDLAVGFVNTPVDRIDAAIDRALGRIGEFAGVDRAYVFRYDFAARTTSNTHEWCAGGIEPMIDQLQGTPMEMFTDWLNTHLAGELMHVPDVDALDPSSGLWQILAPQGIKTVIALPMQIEGECLGFVGFDAVRGVKRWTRGERQLLAVLAELVGNSESRRLREQELVLARATAESAQARLELALRSGSEAIWEWDGNALRTLLSSALLRMIGQQDTTPRWVESDNLVAFLGEDDLDRVRATVQSTIAAGEERFEVEVTGVHAGGGTLPLLVRGAIALDVDGELLRIAGVLVDLTSSKRQEAQAARHLSTQEALTRLSARFVGTEGFDAAMDQALADLAAIFAASRAYLLLLRTDEEVLDNTHEWVAPGVESMLVRTQCVPFDAVPISLERLRRGKAVVVPDVAAMPDEAHADRELYRAQQIRSLLSLPIIVAGELVGVLGLDQVHETDAWSSEDAALLRAAAEVVASALARARSDAELEWAREQAVAANAAKTRFLSTISHELRTPMNGVLGMTDLVLQQELPAGQRTRIEAAHTSASALLALLDDVLDVARIESGQVTLRTSVFDLAAVVDSAAAIARVDARRKGISLEVSIEDAVPERVGSDPGRLRQILANLLNNAVKFTDRGGVHLEVSRPKLPGAATDVVRLRVSDSGIGIPVHERDRVFEPFVQIGRVETRGSADGTGLGLPIVRQLVEVMGGSVALEDRPGGGTLATVDLPLPAAERGSLEVSPPDVGRFQGLRVLVVEDNLVNQEVLRGYLDELGCVVTMADDGGSALLAVDECPVDLVLMDCYMPGIDGLTATQQIRSRADAVGRVPIVAVTADASAAHATACHAAGMDMVMTKPFARVELHQVLHEVVEADRLPTEPPDPSEVDQAGGDPPLPVFDPEPLRVIGQRRPPGDPLVARLVSLFEEHGPRYIEELRASAAAVDTAAYRLAAHTLKSNARTLGLRQLASVSAAAETCVDSVRGLADAQQLARRAEEVATAFTQARTVLAESGLQRSEDT